MGGKEKLEQTEFTGRDRYLSVIASYEDCENVCVIL